jgi:hypothetical protein
MVQAYVYLSENRLKMDFSLSPLQGRPDRQFGVRYSRNKHFGIFVPIDGVMKPDTPEVRELLRRAGYFV